jgi:hypothetical protein
MTPDVDNLTVSELGFVHDIMHGIARERGCTEVNLLPALLDRSPLQLCAMPGASDQNAPRRELTAQAIFPVITLNGQAERLQ